MPKNVRYFPFLVKRVVFICCVLKHLGSLEKISSSKKKHVQHLICSPVGTGCMKQLNLSPLKLIFPSAFGMLSLGTSPLPEKSFLSRLALLRSSHFGKVWMASACRLFLCMKNAWMFPQVLINVILSNWELQVKNQKVLRLYSNVLLTSIIHSHSLSVWLKPFLLPYCMLTTVLYFCNGEPFA